MEIGENLADFEPKFYFFGKILLRAALSCNNWIAFGLCSKSAFWKFRYGWEVWLLLINLIILQIKLAGGFFMDRVNIALLELLESIGLSEIEGTIFIFDKNGDIVAELGIKNNRLAYIKPHFEGDFSRKGLLERILFVKSPKVEFWLKPINFVDKNWNIPITEFVLELGALADEQKLGMNGDSYEALNSERSDVETYRITQKIFSKKGGIGMLNTELFEKVLSTLASLDGFEGAAIANDEGLVLASKFVKKYPEDKIVALVSSAVKEAERVTREANWGKPDNIVIEGETGKLVLYNTSFGFVAVFGNKSLRLGMARMLLNELSEQLG